MTRSTLDPDNLPMQRPPARPPGHDVRSLGPSDSSDSGSDLIGPGVLDSDTLGLDRGTNEDSEAGHVNEIGAALEPAPWRRPSMVSVTLPNWLACC